MTDARQQSTKATSTLTSSTGSTAAPARSHGRADDELRPITLQRGFTRHAEGSVLVAFGDTRVLCTASVLDSVPSFMRGQGRGWVTAEYGMLPRSTHTRSDREAARGKQGGRTLEIQRLIGRSLRMAVDLQALGERSIHLDCDVLQADGGTRTASITGAWVALADAVAWLRSQGTHFGREPLRQAVAAVSVGIARDGRWLLDLDYPEDSGCATDMNVVMTESGGIVEIQGTAEAEPFAREAATGLLDLAATGLQTIFRLQREALQTPL